MCLRSDFFFFQDCVKTNTVSDILSARLSHFRVWSEIVNIVHISYRWPCEGSENEQIEIQAAFS